MPFKQTSFWAETVDWSARGAALDLPETADVAVVGAGFTGLSAGRILAKTGAKVAVIEAESVGWGASSRNGGMVLTGLKLPVGKLVAKYGLDVSQKLYAASLSSIDCVERIISEEGIDCDFVRSGHLVVACKRAHFDEFRRSAEGLARDFQHEVRIVARSELPSEIGSEIYYGGLVDEASAGVNPAKYVAGLARANERAGATLHEQTRVERVARAGVNGFHLITTRGKLWALLATSARETE